MIYTWTTRPYRHDRKVFIETRVTRPVSRVLGRLMSGPKSPRLFPARIVRAIVAHKLAVRDHGKLVITSKGQALT
jgi:hypothetical protein